MKKKPLTKPFIIKTFGTLGTEGNLLNLIKSNYKKSYGNVILNGERLNSFV